MVSFSYKYLFVLTAIFQVDLG